MSELNKGNPCPEARRAALPGSPSSQSHFRTAKTDASVTQPQAQSLRPRFALGYYFVAMTAPLICGLPR